MTSHSAQGLTVERILVQAETGVHPELLNSRFAYVSLSGDSQDATLFTDNMEKLGPHCRWISPRPPLSSSPRPHLLSKGSSYNSDESAQLSDTPTACWTTGFFLVSIDTGILAALHSANQRVAAAAKWIGPSGTRGVSFSLFPRQETKQISHAAVRAYRYVGAVAAE